MDDQQPGPSKPTEKDMTLAEYLALPENKDANLVMPLDWCPHLESIGQPEEFMTRLDLNAKCEECHNVQENWICLVCFSVHCSRYVNEHMLMHGLEKEHVMTLSFSDISVWCYACNDYLDNEDLYPFQNEVHKRKFKGDEMPKRNKIVMEIKWLKRLWNKCL